MRRLPLSLLLLALAGLPPAAGAQVYKWTDANGTVHYADAPPANGTSYQNVKTRTHTPADPVHTAPARSPDEKDASGHDGAARPERVPDTPENRHKLCDNLTSNIQLLESDRVVVTRDGDGHEKAISDDGREQELARARQQYDRFCGQ